MRIVALVLTLMGLAVGSVPAYADAQPPPDQIPTVTAGTQVTLAAKNYDQVIKFRSELPTRACDAYMAAHPGASREAVCSHTVTFGLSAPTPYSICCYTTQSRFVYVLSGSSTAGPGSCNPCWSAQTSATFYYDHTYVWIPTWNSSNCVHNTYDWRYVVQTSWCGDTNNYDYFQMSMGQNFTVSYTGVGCDWWQRVYMHPDGSASVDDSDCLGVHGPIGGP